MHTNSPIRVLFDIQHPAQVHLFKHALWDLEAAGHETLVTSRDKEVTTQLLDAYDIDHRLLSRRRNGLPAAALELGVREVRTLLAARPFHPDVVVSRVSPPAAHTAAALGARSVVVTDTDVDSTLLGRAIHAATLPFADVVLRPPGLDLPTPDRKQRDLGTQELAYLHPDRFTPDRRALERHGVDVDDAYFVVRLAGWDAYHDVGHTGLGGATLRELLAYLSDRGTVYLSTERDLKGVDADPLPVPPHLVHDLLAYADLYVGDSGTMSTEAALVGTPAVRTNSAVGGDDEGIFVTLESEYGLLFSFADGQAALQKVRRLVESDETAAEWQHRHARLLEDATDVTDDLVSVVCEMARGNVD